MDELRNKWERAIERVARMETIVARQIAPAGFLKDAGHDSSGAEEVPFTFLRSWDLAADYELLIRTEIDEVGKLERNHASADEP
jgi:hypothetical protein